MNPFLAVRDYLAGVIAEVRRVVWPTGRQLANYFISVVVGLILATAFVAGIDYLLNRGLTFIIK